jgi:hypothetical protein
VKIGAAQRLTDVKSADGLDHIKLPPDRKALNFSDPENKVYHCILAPMR